MWHADVYSWRVDKQGGLLEMRSRTYGLVIVLVIAVCGCSADAQLAKPEPPKALQQIQPPAADDVTQMKATLIKLQVQVLERDREIGTLRAKLAELQLNALGTALQSAEPAVKKALGLDKQPAPQTPSK